MTKKQLQKENEELRNELDIIQEKAAFWRERAVQYCAVIQQYMQSRQDVLNMIKQAERALMNENIDTAEEGDVNAETEK